MINYRFIGWCKEGRHDKVWIAMQLSEADYISNDGSWGKVLTLWGRRGGRLRSKIVDDDYDLSTLIKKKRDHGGYIQLSAEHLAKVYPKFKADLEKQFIWSQLKL